MLAGGNDVPFVPKDVKRFSQRKVERYPAFASRRFSISSRISRVGFVSNL